MVIAQNDMEFEPSWYKIQNEGADTCNIQWRISQVGCWTDWVYDPLAPIIEQKKPRTQDGIGTNPNLRWTIYEPCDTTICCARQLEVCRYGIDSVSIRDLGLLTESGVDCDTVYAYPPRTALQCYNVCDYLESFNELYPKIPEFNGELHLDTIQNAPNNLIIVYYDQNFLQVIYDNNNESNLDVSIYNYTGKLTINKTQRMISGRNSIDVDLSSLISGVYLYGIVSNGILVKTGKFQIIK